MQHSTETESIQVDLPADMIKKINQMVDKETYFSPKEIILEAMLDWQRRKEIFNEELRKMIQEGIDSGDAGPFDIDEIIAEAKAEMSDK